MKYSIIRPTADGWYWLDTSYVRLDTGQRVDGSQEIVRVAMKYRYRDKEVPMVIAINWREKMDEMPPDWEWAGPIESPAVGEL